MNKFTLPARKSEHVITELETISKDEIVLTGGNFKTGEVLAKNADGKYIKLTAAGTAAGVLLGDVDATDADQKGIAHTRICAVRADKLILPDDATEAQKAKLLSDLTKLNIVPR